jgi:hypothetical protein
VGTDEIKGSSFVDVEGHQLGIHAIDRFNFAAKPKLDVWERSLDRHVLGLQPVVYNSTNGFLNL